jgi:hypothetical protein
VTSAIGAKSLKDIGAVCPVFLIAEAASQSLGLLEMVVAGMIGPAEDRLSITVRESDASCSVVCHRTGLARRHWTVGDSGRGKAFATSSLENTFSTASSLGWT